MATGKMTLEQLLGQLDLGAVPEDHAHDQTLEPTLAPRFRERGRKASERGFAKVELEKTALAPGTEPEPTPSLPPPADEDRSSSRLRVLGPLAEGGMGKIELAEQGGLRREVALKTLRDEFLEESFAARLLREARILGLVEHPNVVPLYGLETDGRNAPVLVMKRIQGVPWRAVMRDPDHPVMRDADRLAWHIRVLMRVCDAVHYGHARGVLHLDLKPENVMIGPFREVVLVDWGVAVCTNEKYRGWLPMADEVEEVLGTPAYLAPEMVDVARRALGPATDVYLLGATLHELLVGKPPHQGESLQAILYAAYEAAVPELPATAPQELSAICRKAMQPDPADRFATVEALRDALSDFLAHRASTRLADKAHTQLVELRALVDAAEEEPTQPGQPRIPGKTDQRNAAVQRLFGRCRFAFAEALHEWEGNDSAREGQREALLVMAHYHLLRGEAASAETLLEELPDEPDEPRAAQLRAEAERQRTEASRLERLGREEADDPGRKTRGKLLLLGAALVSLPIFVAYGLNRAGVLSYHWWHTLIYDVLLAGFFGVGGLLTRRRTASNRRGRRLVLTLVYLTLLAVLLRMVSLAMGLWDLRSTALELFYFGSGCVLAGLLADRRFYVAAPALFVGAVLVLSFPAHAQLIIAFASLIGPGALAYAWMK